MDKGQTIIDLPIAIFFIVLAFLVFFTLVNYNAKDYASLNKYLIITEDAISKSNPNGIGYAHLDLLSKKTTYQNTIDKINLKDPIKEIKIYDTNKSLVFDTGDITCDKKIIIPRLVIYNDKISKADFTFCK